jgi:predicted amidohydrolase
MVLAMALGCNQPVRTSCTSDSGAEVSKPQTVRVGGIILKWVRAEKQANYDRAEGLIRQAAKQGAELIITTECYLDGYAIRDKNIPINEWLELGEQIPGGAYLGRLQGLANELDIFLVAGMLEREGRTTYNSAVIINPDGKLIGHYRKQHLGHELVRNTPGDSSPVFDTAFGKVGLMICADRRYPDTIRKLGEAGAELMLCPSGGMWGPEKNDHHLQARSRENRVPIVFVHPIEFLVTGPDGGILDRRFAGKVMDVPVEGIGGEADEHLVAIYDLPLRR